MQQEKERRENTRRDLWGARVAYGDSSWGESKRVNKASPAMTRPNVQRSTTRAHKATHGTSKATKGDDTALSEKARHWQAMRGDGNKRKNHAKIQNATSGGRASLMGIHPGVKASVNKASPAMARPNMQRNTTRAHKATHDTSKATKGGDTALSEKARHWQAMRGDGHAKD